MSKFLNAVDGRGLGSQSSAGVCRRLVARLCALQSIISRQRQRRALGELDSRLLRDIDVSVDDARRTARKPFWRK